jgi:hypothetical protein
MNVIYDLLFKASKETMLTIAANPGHFSFASIKSNHEISELWRIGGCTTEDTPRCRCYC